MQVIKGEVTVNGTVLQDGDGAAIRQEEKLELRAQRDSEFLLFDLP